MTRKNFCEKIRKVDMSTQGVNMSTQGANKRIHDKTCVLTPQMLTYMHESSYKKNVGQLKFVYKNFMKIHNFLGALFVCL